MLTRRTAVPIAFAVLLLTYFCISARWIILYRGHGLFDIDEFGYLMMAVKNYYAYLNGGLRGWISSVEAPNAASPLTSALASLLFIVIGPRPAYGIYIPLLSCLASIISIYYIAKQCGDTLFAVLTAVVVASTPLLVVYSRSFHFAMPATACTTLALLCLTNSDQGARWPWVIAFGFFAGLMPLARTMTIAFLPGLGLAAFVYVVVAAPDERLKRAGRLAVSAVVACATALTWLLFNGRYVEDYLINFGYGARAAEYGQKMSFLSSALLEIEVILGQVYELHFIVIVVGVLAALILLSKVMVNSRCLVNQDIKHNMLASLSSPISLLSIFILCSFLALSSSQNKGSAFIAPILPATILVSIWSIVNLSSDRTYRIAVFSALCLLSTYAFFPMIDLRSPMAAKAEHWLPVFGSQIFAYGGGTQQGYEEVNGVNTANPGGALQSTTVAAWQKLNNDTLDIVTPFLGKSREVAFGFRNVVYNVNTLGLLNNLRGQPPLNLAQIEPTVVGDKDDEYVAWLQTGNAGPACVLLISPGEMGEFRPYVNSPLLEAAAKQKGFTPTRTLKMPTGRTVTIWTRPC